MTEISTTQTSTQVMELCNSNLQVPELHNTQATELQHSNLQVTKLKIELKTVEFYNSKVKFNNSKVQNFANQFWFLFSSFFLFLFSSSSFFFFFLSFSFSFFLSLFFTNLGYPKLFFSSLFFFFLFFLSFGPSSPEVQLIVTSFLFLSFLLQFAGFSFLSSFSLVFDISHLKDTQKRKNHKNKKKESFFVKVSKLN